MIAAAMIMLCAKPSAKPSDTLHAQRRDRLFKRLHRLIFGWFCAMPCAQSQPESQTCCCPERAL